MSIDNSAKFQLYNRQEDHQRQVFARMSPVREFFYQSNIDDVSL